MDHTPNPFKETVKEYLFRASGHSIAYGMGCAWLGRAPDYRRELEEDLLTLQTAYELGFRYFDTAPAYGMSEKVVGEFVPQVPRDGIFLAAKANLPPRATPQAASEHVRRSLPESLHRLKTDHLDLYQLHDVDGLDNVLPEGGTLDVLRDAQAQGVIRYFGVAVRSHQILEQAVRHGGLNTILTYADYTPLNQSARNLIALAGACGVGVVNASPLYGLQPLLHPEKARVHAGHTDRPPAEPIVARFADLCRAHHVTPLAAALHFPLPNPGIDITLTGPATAQEVRTTAAALAEAVDCRIWDDWGGLEGGPARR